MPPKNNVIVYAAYVDSIKFTGKYAVPRDLEVGPEASAAIIAHLTPELDKAQVSTKNLAVHFECPKSVNKMSMGDFAAAGGVAVAFSLDGSQLLSKIVSLETDIAKEKESRENLRKLNAEALQKVRATERALDELKKTASPEIIAAKSQQLAEEKKATETAEDQVEISKANLEMLQSDLKRSSSIVVRQLLHIAWPKLSAQQQVDVANYRFQALNEQAHPTFDAEDCEAVEHAMHHAGVPTKAADAVKTAFVEVFGRPPVPADEMFFYNSGNPSVKLQKAVKLLQVRQDKQSKVLKAFLDQQKQLMQLMDAQNAALHDLLTDVDEGTSELLESLADL